MADPATDLRELTTRIRGQRMIITSPGFTRMRSRDSTAVRDRLAQLNRRRQAAIAAAAAGGMDVRAIAEICEIGVAAVAAIIDDQAARA